MGREIPIRAEIGRESPEPPAARTRDSCAVAARPPPVFHRKERLVSCAPAASGKPDPPGYRLVSRLWQMDTACLPALRERALSAPQRETEGFLTIPARIGTPFQPFKGNREPEMVGTQFQAQSRGGGSHLCEARRDQRPSFTPQHRAKQNSPPGSLCFALPRHLKRQLRP